MKSLTVLLLLSMQTALHVDKAYAFPIVKAVEEASRGSSSGSMSRGYPVLKREDVVESDGGWKKRAVEMQQAERASTSHPHPTDTSISKPSSSSSSLSSSPEIDSAVREQAAEASESPAVVHTNSKAISKAEYHARAAAINIKHAGKEIFHGPIRGLTEAPRSGLIGAPMHAWVGCRYLASCQVGKAAHHIASVVGKPVMGAVDAVVLTSVGTLFSIPPAVRAAKHFAAMTGHGAKQGYQRLVQGKASEKKQSRQIKLEQARKRPTFIKEETNMQTQTLRTTQWHAHLDGYGRQRSKDRDFSCLGKGGCLRSARVNSDR